MAVMFLLAMALKDDFTGCRTYTLYDISKVYVCKFEKGKVEYILPMKQKVKESI